MGGVLATGQRGTAKSTIVRAFSRMAFGALPVTLPIGATDDRVLGGWRVEDLMASEAVWQPGLIEEAGGNSEPGMLYIDEVNLLDDHLVNIILDVASTGILTVQRDSAAKKPKPVRFSLVGTMNPDEGSLRPQLLDRFGLAVWVESAMVSEERRQILTTVLRFEEEIRRPSSKYLADAYRRDRSRRAELAGAKARLNDIRVPDHMINRAAAVAAEFQIEGHRGELVMLRAARAQAAIGKASEVTPEHLATVGPLALVHRRPSGESGTPRGWSADDEALLHRIIFSAELFERRMPVDDLTTTERITTILICLAVDRRLGGVLFVDLPPALLQVLAQWLNTAMSSDPESGEIITLGAHQSEDDLWWRPGFPGSDGRFSFDPKPGPLIDLPGGAPCTVVIPDLARASLPVQRAAVMLAGSDTAVADRNGWHLEWRPQSRWLAACASSDLGRISRHLLDRFLVRVDATNLSWRSNDLQAIRDAIDIPDEDASARLVLEQPPIRGLWTMDRRLSRMTRAASDRVIETVRDMSATARRDLVLARTARALATLNADPQVSEDHVREAAVLLGFAQPELRRPTEPPRFAPQAASADIRTERIADASDGEPLRSWTQPDDGKAISGISPLSDVAISTDFLDVQIYPEDDPESVPEYMALREPWQLRSRPRILRGPIVGTEPTRSLADIALVATLFEAAKFQPIRRGRAGSARPGMLIWGTDLRQYHRQSQPDIAIVLVLDHTCRRGWDWSMALAPYLRWAYIERAPLTVIEFGHRGCANELRAEMYRANSVLDGRVAISLDRPPGQASPLAYALDLAIEDLHRRLRHGQATIQNAWLVVVSDGRGNVPLEASQSGRLPGLICREGIADALAVAAGARSLSTVRRIVLAPPNLTHHAELPFELADAMNGIVAEIKP